MRRGKRGLGPDFRTLFTANIASSLGDGIARTAIPLLAARLTDDALLIAGTVTMWNILVMSLRQAVIPGGLRGRVHGTWRTLLWGAMPVGSVLGGLVGRIDLALPYLIGGGVATLIAIASYRFLSRLPDAGDVPDPDLVPAATS